MTIPGLILRCYPVGESDIQLIMPIPLVRLVKFKRKGPVPQTQPHPDPDFVVLQAMAFLTSILGYSISVFASPYEEEWEELHQKLAGLA